MKITKTLKRFWSMQKQTGGFTLVELIVVIAILAILAGVAIPAYSGYITKANEAADRQLLSAVNRAFAAACNSKGYAPADVNNGATLTVGTDGKLVSVARSGVAYITGISIKGVNDPEAADEINEAFSLFFAGNEDSAFKTIVNVKLALRNGVFYLPTDPEAAQALNINGKTYYVGLNAIDNFKNSVFADDVDTLQNQVNVLAGTYGGIIDVLSDEQVKELLGDNGDAYLAYLEKMGADNDVSKGNATVLYIAEQTKGMTAQDAMSTLCNAAFYMEQQKADGKTPGLMDMLEAANSTGDTLTTAAMMYGAVTAYANGSDDPVLKEKAANVNDANSLMELISAASADENFLKYCGTYQYNESGVTSSTPSDAFVQDMNGYLGALEGMNSMSGGLDIKDENLWSGEEMDGLLDEMLGN